MYQDILDQINKSPIKNHLGRYNSSRLNETWMTANKLGHIFQTVMEATESIQNRTMGQRFWAFEHLPIPLCECGNPAKKHDSKDQWSLYCSKDCTLHSKTRAKAISNTWKTLDKSEIVVKRANTMIERYGVPYNSQRPEMKEILQKSFLHPDALDKLTDSAWMFQQYVVNNRTSVDIAKELGVYYGTVIDYCKKHGFSIKQRSSYSLEELKLQTFLDSINVSIESNIKTIISPYELDVYIPEHKLAIEVNGLYWHSAPEKQGRHLTKLTMCENVGIELLQFTDNEINTKFDVVCSIISNRLGKSIKLNGRQCKVALVDHNTSAQFLNQNHLHGNCNCKINLGLYFKEELVMIATFGKSRFTGHDWELIRMCPKLNTSIRGGLTKLIAHFRKNYTGSLVSYCNRDIGNGKGYSASGFQYVGNTLPGYFWTDGNVIMSRHTTQKKRLQSWLVPFDPDKTEKDNMLNCGWRQFWNTGNMKFEML